MKSICLLSILIFVNLSSARAATICYFSLNNEKEFSEMEAFTEKLNRYSTEKIEVKEFVTLGDNIESSFEKMASSGTSCDGLVISGHHTGSFGGNRADGKLSIDFMEDLSCDPKYKSFFEGIKGLWLQGCRTLGVEKIEATDTADAHAERVYNERYADDLEQSFLDMNIEFSATLDQDNPLSSRYLRAFPRATTFGWTKIAPGENSQSQFSIPYHIAHAARINDDRKEFFDDPLSTIDSVSATKYSEALLSILNRNDSNDSECKSVQAWIDHGNYPKYKKFSYDNANINAYKALSTGEYGPMWEAKAIECILKNSDKSEDILGSIDKILQNKFLIGYTYNSIYEILQRLEREGDFESLEKLKDKLSQSALFRNFMMSKIQSQEVGIVRKIEYYSLMAELMGVKNVGVEASINKALIDILKKPIRTHDFSLRDDQITLIQALFKHNIISEETISTIVGFKKLDPQVLNSIIVGIGKQKIKNPVEIYGKLITKSNTYMMNSIGKSIGSSSMSSADRDKLIQNLIDNNDELRGKGAIAAIYALDASGCTTSSCSEFISKISKNIRNKYTPALIKLMTKNKVKNSKSILLNIINQVKEDKKNLNFVVSDIGEIQGLSQSEKTGLLSQILKTSNAYLGVSNSLAELESIGAKEILVLDRVLLDDSTCSSCGALLKVLNRSVLSDAEYSRRFEIITQKAAENSNSLVSVTEEILYSSKLNFNDRQKAWGKILAQKTIGDVELFNISNTVMASTYVTGEEVAVLESLKQKFNDEFFKEAFNDLITDSSNISQIQKDRILAK